MPPKPQDARKQKEAKQKKVLLLLAPVLVILLVIQGPKLLKVMNGGGEKTETAAAETAPASTDPAAATPADPSAAPADPSGAGNPAVLAAPAVLVDSDVPPLADEGQLISFGRFVGKDPFNQLVRPEPSQADQPVGDGSDGTGTTQPGDDGSTQEPTEPNTAELTVNDVAESVMVGGSFPASDPIFRLAEIDGETAKIGLVTGSFSTGDATLDLKVGETLTLVSQPDGIRYKIKLGKVLVGTADSSATPETSDTSDSSDSSD